jgi:hypothetical protein
MNNPGLRASADHQPEQGARSDDLGNLCDPKKFLVHRLMGIEAAALAMDTYAGWMRPDGTCRAY